MTRESLLTFEIDREVDLVGLRQQSRRVAEIFAFDTHDQIRIATAVSEIARHAAARGGATVSFCMDDFREGTLLVSLQSRQGQEALQLVDGTLGDEGLVSARRLMDAFTIEECDGRQVITLEKNLPRYRTPPATVAVRTALKSLATLAPDPIAEVRAQNRELLLGLSEVKDKQDDLERLNQELENTNRGVVALYAELDQKSLALLELNRTLEERIEVAVHERERVQDALRQSQKMEAVGQLTGGIAHDFNNLLQAITGNLELVGRHLPPGLERIERSLANAMRASKSASNLTQRLLAFSRQQSLAPRKIDANQLVIGMTELMRRTLGEMVEIRTQLCPTPCVIEIDANELENALLNLAVNARDAMLEGGVLTIETRCDATPVDGLTPAAGADPDAGCVVIDVRDTGIGIPADLQVKVFEPFYTTKEVGKGTGLGLSMVYGFAKQSGGDVTIASVVGVGTTVSLSFPRVDEDVVEELQADVTVPLRGNETILVVEDNVEVLFYSTSALQELGYRVLQAETGPAALKIIASDESIDLLFSDVVLAGGMSGRQLAETAIARRPELRILFTSGYARNALENLGRIESGMELIGKPFTFTDLAARVNAVLQAPRGWMRVADAP